MFTLGLVSKATSMVRAIATFFNLLVLVIILRIFAPGLAAELVHLATNVLEIANETVEELRVSSSDYDAYQDGY